MGAGDGSIIGITKILDNGLESDRFNLVLVAEGYQSAELSQFSSDAQQFVNRLITTQPFGAYQAAFNIFRLDVTSTDSGAADPTACGGTGASPHTYFDGSFCNGNIRRLLKVDDSLVRSVVNAQLQQWHQIIVIVNSPIWGGSGGSLATTSTAAGWEAVAIHELGHSAFTLADEYEYWAGCGIDAGHDNYNGVEPSQVNVTTNTDRNTIKWGYLIDASTPLPTTTNADCTNCDPQASPVPAGTVGAFEGAYYYHCGVYRPEFNCMMRNLAGFCAVCQRRIEVVLQPYMPMVDFPELLENLREHLKLEHKLFIPPWIIIAYLIYKLRAKPLAKDIDIRPSNKFVVTVAQHLGAYLVNNVIPPKEITGPILNLADDYLANRQMSLRAGDYIAIQSFIQKRK